MTVYGDKKPVLIVDGYNLLRSSGAYDDLGVDDYDYDPLNRARDKLISDVAAFAQGKYEAIVVFDGGGNSESEGKPVSTAGIKVIFSAAGTDADQAIERISYKARRDEREVLVLSSDWAVQNATFRDGVTRMSAVGFAHEMDDVRTGLEENSRSTTKNTMAERIDPEVRAKLEALARGEDPGDV